MTRLNRRRRHPQQTLPPINPPNTVQLLHKLKVRSADGKATLLKVVKNPISRHLPPGCKVYGMSVTGNLYNPMALACALPEDKPVVFVIGAMAAGHITMNRHPYVSLACWLVDRHRRRVAWFGLVCFYLPVITQVLLMTISSSRFTYQQIEEMISVSDFPLSGATAINRILGAIESNWGIV